MLKKQSSTGFAPVWISLVLIIAVLGLAIFLSPTFQECIERGASDSRHGKQRDKPTVEAFRCAVSVIDDNHNLIVAIDPLTGVSFEALKGGTSVLWLWGFLRYSSIMKTHYVVGYCARLDPDSGRFVLYGIGMLCGGCAALDYGKLHCPWEPTWLLLKA